MGVVVLLKFGAKCFDILAWPLFALCYPLWASIRAIELNSNSDVRKLVTYWVLFTLISLFDHAFVTLLEWLPFWPYIKLLVICCLVIPHFDGAIYVYEHLVQPCFSVNPQVVINQFSKPKETFLVAAERYIKENGSEALEKLIASKIKAVAATEEKELAATDWFSLLIQSTCKEPNDAQKDIKAVEQPEKNEAAKQSKCKEPNVAQKDIKAVELTEKKTEAAEKWVMHAEANLAQIEKKTVAADEIKEIVGAAAAAGGRDNELPEIPTLKNVQKKWTCALCQVTTQSEITMNSHLQGKGHKAKYKATAKNKGASASGQCKQKKAKNPNAEMKHSALWCSICNIWCPSEIHMTSHLYGGKHMARMQECQDPLSGW